MSKLDYGETQESLDADKLLECRKIVKNIINFGISEAQKIQIIYLFGLELESRKSLEMITDVIKIIRNDDKDSNFILNKPDSEYNQNSKDKKILNL